MQQTRIRTTGVGPWDVVVETPCHGCTIEETYKRHTQRVMAQGGGTGLPCVTSYIECQGSTIEHTTCQEPGETEEHWAARHRDAVQAIMEACGG